MTQDQAVDIVLAALEGAAEPQQARVAQDVYDALPTPPMYLNGIAIVLDEGLADGEVEIVEA